MATPEPPDPIFPDDICGEIGDQLQLTLVELIALSLSATQLRWNIYGREFLSVRGHLARVVDEWRELETAVAERAAAIGICPDGTPAAVIELANLRPLDPGFTDAGSAIGQICEQLREVALRVRQRLELLGTLDIVSHNVLTITLRTLEEQLWMMRAQLPD